MLHPAKLVDLPRVEKWVYLLLNNSLTEVREVSLPPSKLVDLPRLEAPCYILQNWLIYPVVENWVYLLLNWLPYRGKRSQCVIFWPFDPAKNAIQRWCTGRRWHILMAVMRGNRVGGNWLMKWDELKKLPWYTHRLMHRKRVTSELHDSYFRLMTIKHSISKIEWALNDYIIQMSSTSQWSCQLSYGQMPVELKIGRSWRRDVVGKATPDRGDLREPRWSLGSREDADKMQ